MYDQKIIFFWNSLINSLCSPGWLQTPRDPPASLSRALGLQAGAITSDSLVKSKIGRPRKKDWCYQICLLKMCQIKFLALLQVPFNPIPINTGEYKSFHLSPIWWAKILVLIWIYSLIQLQSFYIVLVILLSSLICSDTLLIFVLYLKHWFWRSFL